MTATPESQGKAVRVETHQRKGSSCLYPKRLRAMRAFPTALIFAVTAACVPGGVAGTQAAPRSVITNVNIVTLDDRGHPLRPVAARQWNWWCRPVHRNRPDVPAIEIRRTRMTH